MVGSTQSKRSASKMAWFPCCCDVPSSSSSSSSTQPSSSSGVPSSSSYDISSSSSSSPASSSSSILTPSSSSNLTPSSSNPSGSSSSPSGSGSSSPGGQPVCELRYCSGFWTFTGYDDFGCSTGFLTELYNDCVDIEINPSGGSCDCPSAFGSTGPSCGEPEYPDNPPHWDGLVYTIACRRLGGS